MNLATLYLQKSMDSAFWVTRDAYVESDIPFEQEAHAALENMGYINCDLAIKNLSTNETTFTEIRSLVLFSHFDLLLMAIDKLCTREEKWNEARVNIRAHAIGVTLHYEDDHLSFLVTNA